MLTVDVAVKERNAERNNDGEMNESYYFECVFMTRRRIRIGHRWQKPDRRESQYKRAKPWHEAPIRFAASQK
jgi:hypothetical protein